MWHSTANVTDVWENLFNVSTEEFFSKKITNKLVQQLQVLYIRWCIMSVLECFYIIDWHSAHKTHASYA